MSNYEKRCILFLSLIVTQSLFCRPQASQQRPTVNAKPKYTKTSFPQKTKRLLNLYWKEFLVSCGIVGVIVWKLRRGASSTSTGKNIPDTSAWQSKFDFEKGCSGNESVEAKANGPIVPQPKFDPKKGPFSPDQTKNQPNGWGLLCTFYARANAWIIAKNAMEGRPYDVNDAAALAKKIILQTAENQRKRKETFEKRRDELNKYLDSKGVEPQTEKADVVRLEREYAKMKDAFLTGKFQDPRTVGKPLLNSEDENKLSFEQKQQLGFLLGKIKALPYKQVEAERDMCLNELFTLEANWVANGQGCRLGAHFLTPQEQAEWDMLPILQLELLKFNKQQFAPLKREEQKAKLGQIKSMGKGAFIVPTTGEHDMCIDYDAARVDLNGQSFPFVMRNSLTQFNNPNPPDDVVHQLKDLLGV